MATNPLFHYALDLETPPLIACDAPDVGPFFSTFPRDVTCPDCMTHEQFPRLAAQSGITRRRLLLAAADLLSDEGENPEYDRAIAELTSTLLKGE